MQVAACDATQLHIPIAVQFPLCNSVAYRAQSGDTLIYLLVSPK
jgi:hypothetical protein